MEEENKEPKIFSVSEYIVSLNNNLNLCRAKIIGEVSEVGFGPTGNVYFSIKDKKGESILTCMIFKNKYDIYGIELKEGLKITINGYPNVHKIYGFKFIAETIEHAGEGELKKEYEKLKKRLTEEGAFAEERKRKIPKYPQEVGVITSLRSGAVIADFCNNLGNFGFRVKMVDSRVEGQEALTDLLNSIKFLKKQNLEVIVIMRGGGSLESMVAFNNEALVREIISSPIPVIAAIGHHKDVPLVALAADLSVSTPSMAAIVLSKSWEEAINLLERYERNILDSFRKNIESIHYLINNSINTVRASIDDILKKYIKIENNLKISFQNFKNILSNRRLFLKELSGKYLTEFKHLLSRVDQKLEEANKMIKSYNPERQFKLGYSIIRNKGKIVKSIKDVKIGEEINIKIIDGLINSKVNNINKLNNQ